MGSRLPGFDYSLPYFYMVTIRRNDGYPALSRVCGDAASHYLEGNWITRLFVDIIMTFHETWYCIEPIRCFSIMPDHIHLLIKIRDIEKRVSLAVIVRMLMRAMEKGYFALAGASAGKTPTSAKGDATSVGTAATGAMGDAAREGATPTSAKGDATSVGTAATGARGDATIAGGATAGAKGDASLGRAQAGAGGMGGAVARSGGQHLFAFDWHDWIVKADGQLAAFTRYIRENPERSWRHKSHREYFQRVNEVSFLGRKWYGYGNTDILKSPILEPMRYSRKLAEGGKEWNAAVARARRIGPGGAGVGTFMSPCEKACGHALGLAGGRWVVLSPEGFGERWHPGRQYERFCAEGRMLFLSLWPAMAREPTKAELYDRCHLMGDIIVEGLIKSDCRPVE